VLDTQPKIRIQSWNPDYGSPDEMEEPESGNLATIPEGEPFGFVEPVAAEDVPLAFVDGTEHVEANLVQETDGRAVPGIACAYAIGSVVIPVGEPLRFEHCRAERLVIWSGGAAVELPAAPGGWSWRTVTVPATGLKATRLEMVRHRRAGEAALGQLLDDAGYWVVCDGTDGRLFEARRSGEPRRIAGCIKSHHVQLLPDPYARQLSELPAGYRTTLFRTPSNRYSCYLRLEEPRPWQASLSAVLRLEFAGKFELEPLRRFADLLAYHLPRFASLPHVDPRAPQNLQPIGALEKYLRRLLGDRTLARRSLYDVVGRV